MRFKHFVEFRSQRIIKIRTVISYLKVSLTFAQVWSVIVVLHWVISLVYYKNSSLD